MGGVKLAVTNAAGFTPTGSTPPPPPPPTETTLRQRVKGDFWLHVAGRITHPIVPRVHRRPSEGCNHAWDGGLGEGTPSTSGGSSGDRRRCFRSSVVFVGTCVSLQR